MRSLFLLAVFMFVSACSEKGPFDLKSKLSKLRMPFAKQEYEGKRTPIVSEASVYSVDTARKDLKFEIKGTVLSVRGLIGAFNSVFDSIKYEDILRKHGTSYPGAS